MGGMGNPDSADPGSFPWLVADIGGTNARFGLVHRAGAPVSDVRTLRCADYPDPATAALAYLDALAGGGARLQPRHACFALASPIDTDPVKMTNSAWLISRTGARAALGLDSLTLLNDFEALALALPRLAASDMIAIGSAAVDRTRTMAVTGPGTGLGVGICMPVGARWVALAGEGGHVTAAAADDFESDVLRVIRREYPHVSAERVLSGIGLPLLHRAVAEVRGRPVLQLGAEEIGLRAIAQHDPDCAATLDAFCAMLGSFAGNLALTSGARGGVFIAGGIAQKLDQWLAASAFRTRFEAKGRYQDYMRGIATALITAPYCALLGAAQGIENRRGAE
jgi:glucokinase